MEMEGGDVWKRDRNIGYKEKKKKKWVNGVNEKNIWVNGQAEMNVWDSASSLYSLTQTRNTE